MNRGPLLFAIALAVALLAGCGSQEPLYQGKTLTAWIDQMGSKHMQPHCEAVEAAVAIGQGAYPALARRLDDNDFDVCCGVATAMLRLDPKAALPDVRSRLSSDVPRMRVMMAIALIRANVEPGLAIPVLVALMDEEDYFPRNRAIMAMSELGPQSTGAVMPLAEVLGSHQDADVRQRAAYALVRIGPGAAGAVAALRQALNDPDARVRKGAAYALGAIGPAAREAKEALRVALHDKAPEVRGQVQKALQAIE
jgi:HEAT repeat protein